MPNTKLLIIDDDKDDIFFLTEAFLKKNDQLNIVSFDNAQHAFSYLATLCPEKFPALIITDLNMPKLNGFEFLRQLKTSEILRTIPVVISSNSSLEVNKTSCFQLGAKAYFVKPYLLEEYLKMVDQLLECIKDTASV